MIVYLLSSKEDQLFYDSILKIIKNKLKNHEKKWKEIEQKLKN